jgi:hypothetical protein
MYRRSSYVLVVDVEIPKNAEHNESRGQVQLGGMKPSHGGAIEGIQNIGDQRHRRDDCHQDIDQSFEKPETTPPAENHCFHMAIFSVLKSPILRREAKECWQMRGRRLEKTGGVFAGIR